MRGRNSDRPRAIALAAVIIAATLITFSPILQNGFIDWDDEANFVANDAYQGLGWTELRWMLTTFHRGVYQPLAWLLAAIEFTIGGVAPWIFHGGSWILHATAAGLLFALGRRLFTTLKPNHPLATSVAAAAAACFWALHPLRVEGVAWASAQGYPLAAVFALGAIATWLRARLSSSGRSTVLWSTVSVVLAACAYLAKPVAVTLPAIVMLLEWYHSTDSRVWVTKHVWRRVVPYAVPAVLVAIAAPLARLDLGTAASARYDLMDRIAQACYSTVYYALKTVVPSGLTIFTPLPDPFRATDPPFLVAVVVVVATGTLVLWYAGRAKGLAAFAAAYVILLAPVLGIIRQGDQLVADRYSYLAGIPLSLAAGVTLLTGLTAGRRYLTTALTIVAIVVIGTLGIRSWQLAHVWRDPGTLWTHAVAVDPASYQAHTNLGLHELRTNRFESAIREFDTSISINPQSSNARFNRGLAFAQWGRASEAILAYRDGLRLDPTDAKARAHLAELLASVGRWGDAEAEYRAAAALHPHPDLYNRLGIALAEQGRFSEAVDAFRTALSLAPNHADARENLNMAEKLARATPPSQ